MTQLFARVTTAIDRRRSGSTKAAP